MMQDELQNRTLTIKRTFDADVALVWEAWTEPEHIAEWWEAKGTKVNIVELDFRVGGKWKYSTPMPDGNEFISEGIYSVIIELQKIFTSADFRGMIEGVEMRSLFDIQLLFEEAGEKTNFTFHVIYATEELCKQQEKMGFYDGWGAALDRLNASLRR